ncbi:hypothetical protein RHSIM_Rhsim02G0072600 [Rhododendron simsii]|uniref:RNase H type-1 domain-containing protein n=1 Tax=Rhododendron simsii TaxID=118357 RepID=A0A834HB41_RHOSS|nr:hypothetical protein RHSIM_Rhsim02G0072600 [Rhododendron simsii]
MKKGTPFDWDEACDNAFKSIKSYLTRSSILTAPKPGRPLILYVAAQERSVGALFAQENDEGKEGALYYLSRMMLPHELNYSTIEKMCLALVFAIEKMRHYFQAHTVHLISKANPIKYVMTKPVLTDRLARWSLLFQQYEIIYVPQKAIKGQALADFLAYHPIPAEWELSEELPDEDVMVKEMSSLPYAFTLTQNCSNNEAEYQALILGLEMAVEVKHLQLKVYGDSMLIINQLLDVYEVRKPELMPFNNYARRLIAWLGGVTLEHVPRGENKQADALAKLASTLAFPDQETHIPICRSWVVPPIFDDEDNDERQRKEFLQQCRYQTLPEIWLQAAYLYYVQPACEWSCRSIQQDSWELIEEVYGMEAVLPLERQIPSLRMAVLEGLTHKENARLRLEELEALDEKRLEA